MWATNLYKMKIIINCYAKDESGKVIGCHEITIPEEDILWLAEESDRRVSHKDTYSTSYEIDKVIT